MKNWVIEAIGLVLFLGLGIASVLAAAQITGFSFDPLGSKSAPYAAGGFTIALSLIGGLFLIRDIGKPQPPAQEQDSSAERIYSAREIIEVLGLLLLAILYVIALFKLRTPFSLTTMVFLPVAACLLERTFKGRIPVIALMAGTIIGFGGELLFTKVFFIDLPTLW